MNGNHQFVHRSLFDKIKNKKIVEEFWKVHVLYDKTGVRTNTIEKNLGKLRN